jgi:hypothetical protein
MIETDITINVYADEDYHYAVSAGGVIGITYVEHTNGETAKEDRNHVVHFGSLDEMESVAKAMLKIVANSR